MAQVSLQIRNTTGGCEPIAGIIKSQKSHYYLQIEHTLSNF